MSEFYPIDYIPRGVRLTAYAGGADLEHNRVFGMLVGVIDPADAIDTPIG